MHWGNEYQTTESDYQARLAQLLCDGGADLIIGTHPHVLQPMKWLEREDGHKTLCAYSLGNFVSNQHKRMTMLGGILEVELLFDEDGTLLEIPTDSVILSVGYNSAPIAPKAKNVHLIGDASKVGNLRTVIWGAWDTCMKL